MQRAGRGRDAVSSLERPPCCRWSRSGKPKGRGRLRPLSAAGLLNNTTALPAATYYQQEPQMSALSYVRVSPQAARPLLGRPCLETRKAWELGGLSAERAEQDRSVAVRSRGGRRNSTTSLPWDPAATQRARAFAAPGDRSSPQQCQRCASLPWGCEAFRGTLPASRSRHQEPQMPGLSPRESRHGLLVKREGQSPRGNEARMQQSFLSAVA